jgi:hypothetical protein
MSDNIIAQNGPGPILAISITLMPFSGPKTFSSPTTFPFQPD